MPTMARALVDAAMTAIVQPRRGGRSSAFLLVFVFRSEGATFLDRRARPGFAVLAGSVGSGQPSSMLSSSMNGSRSAGS